MDSSSKSVLPVLPVLPVTVPMPTRTYRVWRTEVGVYQEYSCEYSCWEGADLATYYGGQGCYDEGDFIATRTIQVSEDGGETWANARVENLALTGRRGGKGYLDLDAPAPRGVMHGEDPCSRDGGDEVYWPAYPRS